jgi:hypothetical protein
VLEALLLAGLGLLIVEGIARVCAKFVSERVPDRKEFLAAQTTMVARLANDESIRERIHPVLGWEYGTAHGLRGAREYGAKTRGLTRIAAFGDSYVYCNEVTDAESWPAQIEAGWKGEVLNYGVGGYGADQAYLRFRDTAAQFDPDVVILGFTPMMATRAVSRYRRFQDPTDGPWFKPRFVLDGDALRLIPAPIATREDANRLVANPSSVAEFGRDDFWYNSAVFEHGLYTRSATYRILACLWPAIWRRYFHHDRIYRGGTLNSQSEAFKVLALIFRDFAAGVKALGAEPRALMLPPRSDVNAHARGARVAYDTFRARIADLGMAVIDPVDALTSSPHPVEQLFAEGGHYSVTGNAVIAKVVADALRLAPRT